MPDAALLKVAGLHAWYGESHILHGVDFAVGEGELVTLLGRNGAGKTTILKAIMGLVDRRRGSVAYAGRKSAASSPASMSRKTCCCRRRCGRAA